MRLNYQTLCERKKHFKLKSYRYICSNLHTFAKKYIYILLENTFLHITIPDFLFLKEAFHVPTHVVSVAKVKIDLLINSKIYRCDLGRRKIWWQKTSRTFRLRHQPRVERAVVSYLIRGAPARRYSRRNVGRRKIVGEAVRTHNSCPTVEIARESWWG